MWVLLIPSGPEKRMAPRAWQVIMRIKPNQEGLPAVLCQFLARGQPHPRWPLGDRFPATRLIEVCK